MKMGSQVKRGQVKGHKVSNKGYGISDGGP